MKPPIQVKVPVENVNDLTARLVSCRAASGSLVAEGAVIAELETTKTTFDVLAPADGYIEFLWRVDDEVPVGETLCNIHKEAPESTGVSPERKADPKVAAANLSFETLQTGCPASTVDAADQGSTGLGLPFKHVNPSLGGVQPIYSQKAIVLIKELKIDLSAFTGFGFVREEDVRRKYACQTEGAVGSEPVLDPRPEAKLKPSGSRPEIDLPGQTIKLERSKLYENKELLHADRSVLKSTLYRKCNARIVSRNSESQMPPISRLPLILFEVSKLLRKYRFLNSTYIKDSLYVYDIINIGFAVEIDNGLKVLVIRNSDSLDLEKLTEVYEELLVKYMTNTLQVEDVTGSTFTVTDLSKEGISTFDPIINRNQAAILGIGCGEDGPQNEESFMLSCAFDHQLVGGKLVAGFLSELCTRLEAHASSLELTRASKIQIECSRCLRTSFELEKLDAMLVPSIHPAGYLCSLCFSGH